MSSVTLYDTTLRDGSQREGVSMSVEDKLKILVRLDALGIHYVEGGWPGSNPKDEEFFQRAAELSLDRTTLTAFGMTRRPGVRASEDANLTALLEAKTDVVCIVGKSWKLHVTETLRTSLEENLEMISDSVKYLSSNGVRVFFDAEHFFDGYRDDPGYSVSVLKAALSSGAELLVLCDTNGGTLPHYIEAVFGEVSELIDAPLGGHFHDDCGVGVANSLSAVRAGAVQVQGCVNGYGERCGNADLLVTAANLQLKMGIKVLDEEAIAKLAEVSAYVAEVCNVAPETHRAFVGQSAFAHKGGLHVSAVLKQAQAYEHIPPDSVGNSRRLLVSDLAGTATLKAKAREYSVELKESQVKEALRRLKELEAKGWAFEAADGSLELLLREAGGWRQQFFHPLEFRAIVQERAHDQAPSAEATVKLNIGGERTVAAAEGHGPVNALDRALRVALKDAYPAIEDFHLTDYKVRILDSDSATAARVRVLIESADSQSPALRRWTTVGVSENIIEASWLALLDSIALGLLRRGVAPAGSPSTSESFPDSGSKVDARRRAT